MESRHALVSLLLLLPLLLVVSAAFLEEDAILGTVAAPKLGGKGANSSTGRPVNGGCDVVGVGKLGDVAGWKDDRRDGCAAGDGGVAAEGAAADPRAAGAGVRGGGDEQAGPRGAGDHGRRVPLPAGAHRRPRHHRHRQAARGRAPGRHGRAAHPGGGGVGAQEQEPREDARVRPRRPRRHAPRRRQDTQGPRAPPQDQENQPQSVVTQHDVNTIRKQQQTDPILSLSSSSIMV